MSHLPDEHDDWLSDQLRQVRVPPGLRSRLQQLTVVSDAELDAELRAVDVPPQLRAALQGVPRRAAWERRGQQARRLTQWALAASVLLVCTVTYYSVVLRSIWETMPLHVAQEWVFSLDASWERPSRVETTAPVAIVGQPPLVEASHAVSLARLVELPRVQPLVSTFSPIDNTTAQRPVWRLPLLADPLLLAAQEATLPMSGDSLEEALTLPRLGRPSNGLGRGAQAKILAQSQFTKQPSPVQVPLVASLASYELARDLARRGVWPAPSQVHSEEFVAALAPLTVAAPTLVTPAPTPAQPRPAPYVPTVNWQLSAGPSPLSSPERVLFHVSMRVRDLPSASHPTTHLAVVVDTSASMEAGERLAQVQRALLGLLPQLRGQDRLDLIAAGDRPRVVVEGISIADVAAWRAAVASLTPQRGGHLFGGWLTALSLIRADHGSAARRRVLLLTDGREPLDESMLAQWKGTLDGVRREGIVSDLVQVSPLAPAAPVWERLVQLSGGKIYSATRPAQLSGLLVEQLTGRSQVVFTGAKLSVQFPSLAAANYRLLGHESAGIDASESKGVASELYSGETVAASFEVWPTAPLAPGTLPGADTDWAVATLEWPDPKTGEIRKLSQRLLRGQLKTSAADTTPAWQTATVAVTLAEILRGAPLAQRTTVSDVASWARQIASTTSEQREFRDFLTLLEQLDAARPKAGPARTIKPR